MTTQGAPNNHRLATINDLDALLAKHSLAPTVVRLGGHDYNVRTDLNLRETNLVLALMQTSQTAQGLTILVDNKSARDKTLKAVEHNRRLKPEEKAADVPAGPAGQRLADYLESLPRMHEWLVVARIYRASLALAQHAASDEVIYADFGYAPPADVEPEGDQGES